MPGGDRGRGLLFALAGVLFLSPDTLFVRLIGLTSWPLLFYRGLGVALMLTLGLTLVYRRRVLGVFLAVGRIGILAGVLECVSNLLFILALAHTSVANVLTIISTSPLFGSVLSRLFLGERLPVRTWVAASLSVPAVTIIALWGSGGPAGGELLLGNLLALCHALVSASGFVVVRRCADRNMVPCMALSGVLTCLFGWGMASGGLAVPPGEWPDLAVLCLVFLPMSFGLLVMATRFIPAPEVSMIMLLEMLLGPFFVWLATGETVAVATFFGGGMLLLILLAHSWLGLREARR